MLKPISVGNEYFNYLIKTGSYYVDKTPFIKTVFGENTSRVLLITRPRRFGKTLMMSTFYDFFSLGRDGKANIAQKEELFKETQIYKDRDFCNDFMGRFPVIFISLKSVTGRDFNEAYNQLAFLISSLAGNYRYLRNSAFLEDDERQQYLDLLDFKLLKDQSDRTILLNSLATLTKLLYKHHQIEPMLLIDEYDVPIAKSTTGGFYRDMIDVIGPFLGSALKTNEFVGRTVLTGCLRAAKESIFTGLNNFKISSVLDSWDDSFSSGIGFTEDETQNVLSYYGLSDYFDIVRHNYDGYTFGSVHMYCPWDVMSFCDDAYRKDRRKEHVVVPENYWINTSGNDVIEEYLGVIEPKNMEKMQDLLDGGSVVTPVRPQLCYGDLFNHNITDFWTLLLYTGYLTFDHKFKSPNYYDNKNAVLTNITRLYSLHIPNLEIRQCFSERILNYLQSNPIISNQTRELILGLFQGDGELVQDRLNKLLSRYVSIRDFASNSPRENYYHGFINGLLINGSAEICEQKTNLESGNGYVDLIVKSSAEPGTVVILELKQTPDVNKDKVPLAQDTLDQIIEMKYADNYLTKSDVINVFAFGVCFCRKECSVLCSRLK